MKNERKQQQWERRLCNALKRIWKLQDLATPDPIILNELAILHRLAVGYFGDDYLQRINQHEVQFSREYAGLCVVCGDVMPERRGNVPACPKCIAAETTEYFRILVEHGDDELSEEEEKQFREAMEEDS